MTPRLRRLLLLGAFSTPLWAEVAPKPAVPKITFSHTAIIFADQVWQLYPDKGPTPAQETQFETDNGFADFKGLKDAFESAVTKAADVTANGIKPGTSAFTLLLSENMGVASVPAAPVAAAPKPPADDTPAPAPDPNAPLLTGLKDLRGASKTQVLFLAHVYRIPPPGYEQVENQQLNKQVTSLDNKWDSGIELLQNGLELDAISLKANPVKDPKVKGAAADQAALAATAAAVAEYRVTIPVVAPTAIDPFPDSFTALLTAHGTAVIAGTATKATQAAAAAADAAAKAKAAEVDAAGAKTGTTPPKDPAPVAGTTPGTKTPAIIDPTTGAIADTVLRNFGVSFGAGIGDIYGTHASPVIESALIRWNWIQRQATIRWNDKQSIAGQGAKRVAYGISGIQGTKLMESTYGYDARTKDMERLFWTSDWVPTSLGPFFGTAVPGNYATFGHNPDGTPIKERPYLTGLQIGWLFYDQAGSLVYLDIGTSVSPNSGFRYSRPYFGISADGIVLLKLIDGLRSFVPGTTGTTGSN